AVLLGSGIEERDDESNERHKDLKGRPTTRKPSSRQGLEVIGWSSRTRRGYRPSSRSGPSPLSRNARQGSVESWLFLGRRRRRCRRRGGFLLGSRRSGFPLGRRRLPLVRGRFRLIG